LCFEGGVKRGSEVVEILDMREGKHKLNFVVGSDLIPFVIINLPFKEMNIGVFSSSSSSSSLSKLLLF
jgi:hypothetical protein